MNHTKRTREFQSKIDRFCEKLAANTLDRDERAELASILQTFTTDNRCIVRADLNEPIFPIKGGDIIGALTVKAWIDKARETHTHGDKIDDAVQCAEEMKVFRATRYSGVAP